nr:MAG TPA: hypothetical protein [Caudoviricetes sp.]
MARPDAKDVVTCHMITRDESRQVTQYNARRLAVFHCVL